MDIADFLAARYDEEQRLAEWAAKPHSGPQAPGDTAVWQVEEWVPSEHEEGAVPAAIWVTDRSEMGIGQMRPDRGIPAHIAYWDPARVLADVTAKRKRLALYVETEEKLAQALKDAPWKDDPAFAHTHARQRININELSGRYAAYRMSVRLDSVAFEQHPDFKPEWRIDD